MSKKIIEIYKKIRKFWKINPKTRIKKNRKIYNRAKAKQEFRRRIKEEL